MAAESIVAQRPKVEAWQKMLRKALADKVEVRQLVGSGAWVATSASDPTIAYEVSLHECACPGNAKHCYCKHRALLAHRLGHLPLRSHNVLQAIAAEGATDETVQAVARIEAERARVMLGHEPDAAFYAAD